MGEHVGAALGEPGCHRTQFGIVDVCECHPHPARYQLLGNSQTDSARATGHHSHVAARDHHPNISHEPKPRFPRAPSG